MKENGLRRSTLSASRRLVTVGDTLYMIDSHDAVVWKWDVGHGEDIMDRPYVNSHGQIFGIALDGIVFSLDSYGKERWRWQINGSYSFTQLKPYRDGQYLMVLDASAYRKFKGFNEDDVLYLCRDRDVITTVSFPRTARLALNGNQIFAVTMHQHRQRKQRIVIPGRA